MEIYAGLDLHSRNTYIGIMDKTFKRVFKKRVPNHLEHILQTLDPFRDQIKGFVVESTYNWYWLVDGLMEAGYSSVHLANPAAIKQYEGLKHSEAVHLGRRHNERFRRYYNRKVAPANTSLAMKALGNKLARICYFIIRDQVPFREEMFCQ